MACSIIYTVAEGKLTAMAPAAPENEDVMQRLVADHPEIIADEDGALLLIRREQPIADAVDGGGRWSVDHLFVTRDGVPVLVELKRASDTRLRREVVGQMLDYAANATAHWRAGTIAASFAATAEVAGCDPDLLFAEFLGEGGDAEAFWRRVDDSFMAGRIKLVFVADTIPRELARIIEFLNEQMTAEVRGVELSWFEGDGVKAFTPRVIGETARARNAKAGGAGPLPAMAVEEWVAEYLAPFGPEMVAAAGVYTAIVEEAGGTPEVTSTRGSIVAACRLRADTLYPLMLSRYGKGSVQLALGYLVSRPAFADEAVRRALYDELAAIVGPLSTRTLNGFPAFPATRLNDARVRDEVAAFLARLLARAQ